MDLDSGLIEYMKKRAEYAKLVATVLSVQCFLLAVFFCEYGLWINQLAYSKSRDTLKVVIILIAVILSLVMVAFNYLVVLKSATVYKLRPDYIALRQSSDTVVEAYAIARPVLIYKITMGLLIMVASGFIYIILRIALDRTEMSGIYGRMIVAVAIGIGLLFIIPSLDRIRAYRVILNEIHTVNGDTFNYVVFFKVASILTPMSIGAWYILRFYTDKRATGWIVFPVMALFGLAICYLIGWSKEEIQGV